MEGLEAKTIVKALDIPKSTLARLAGVHETSLYAFLDGKSTAPINRHKIATTLGEIQRWYSTLSFPPSFKDWRAIQQAIGDYRVAHLREVGPDVVRAEYEVQATQGSGE